MNANATKHIVAWSLAQQKHCYVVVSKQKSGTLLYIETPEEAGTHHPRESLLRVFNSREEAKWYLATVAEYNLDAEFEVIKTSLEDLFADASKINVQLTRTSHSTLRIELCHVASPSEFAKETDTLWSPHTLKN